MSKPKTVAIEERASAARPCIDQIPYRMVMFSRVSAHGAPLYLVAGSSTAASRARKALKEAHRLHGGDCFYCKKPVAAGDLALDHAEPIAAGGTDQIQNLLIACKPCNAAKGHKAIEAYKPDAGREWLSALLKQVQDRLNRLGD